MRIAIISDYYLDYLGGAQVSMIAQKNALTDAGHQVFLLAPLKPPNTAVPEWLNRPSFRLKSLELPVFKNGKKIRSNLKEFFETNKIEVVHIQTEFGLANAAIGVANEMGLPVLHTVHTIYWQAPGKLQKPVATVMRALLRKVTGNSLVKMTISGSDIEKVLQDLTLNTANSVDAVISPSAHQLSDMQAAGVSSKAIVLTNPFTKPNSEPAKPLPKTLPRIALIGRLVPEKRPLEFIKASVLAQKKIDFELKIIGDGPLLEQAKILAKDANITFTGRLNSDLVQQEIDNSHCVAVVSYGFDNQPMTIIEAISRHRGVFYVDPKLTPIIEDAGFPTEPDIQSMADGIVSLLKDAQLEKLSLAATTKSADFSPETFVKGYEQLVSELSGNRSA
ncbi:MAG: glycosyltransferase [Microbacteriaceae bacterium]|nr:glycosyltransferase [Microbacteriaceae bacterium]